MYHYYSEIDASVLVGIQEYENQQLSKFRREFDRLWLSIKRSLYSRFLSLRSYSVDFLSKLTLGRRQPTTGELKWFLAILSKEML